MLKVPAAYTSQRRSACRAVDPKSHESQAVYRCTTWRPGGDPVCEAGTSGAS
ncbi:hypothetical protein [Lentzea sp. CA-135723]|uniref:hypothetical protein n=1 Tax=Lentzea sp. CA-135723 TaxID=3239950 RepID=UPI003D8F8D27